MARLTAMDADGDGARLGGGRTGVGVGPPALVSVPGDSLGDADGTAAEGGGDGMGVAALAEAVAGADIIGVGTGVAEAGTGAGVRSGRSTSRIWSPPAPSSAIITAWPSLGESMIVRGSETKPRRCW